MGNGGRLIICRKEFAKYGLTNDSNSMFLSQLLLYWTRRPITLMDNFRKQ